MLKAKILKINMYNPETGELEIKEFEATNPGITAFDYSKKSLKISENYDSFDAAIAIACEYFPKVIGKEAFAVEGLSKDLKFSDVLEEYFINDPNALSELVNEVGFFLSPALKARMNQ